MSSVELQGGGVTFLLGVLLAKEDMDLWAEVQSTSWCR